MFLNTFVARHSVFFTPSDEQGSRPASYDRLTAIVAVIVSTVIAAIVVTVVVPPAIIAVPAVIVSEITVRRPPMAFVIAAALPVGCYPVRVRFRRARPVTVVPAVAAVIEIPIAFDPFVSGARIWWHPIRPWRRRRRAELNAERDLCARRQRRHCHEQQT